MYGIYQPEAKCFTSVLVGKDSTAALASREAAEEHKRALELRFPEVKFEVREWSR